MTLLQSLNDSWSDYTCWKHWFLPLSNTWHPKYMTNSWRKEREQLHWLPSGKQSISGCQNFHAIISLVSKLLSHYFTSISSLADPRVARRPHTFHAITRAHDELSHVTVRTASVMRADTSTTGNSLAHPPPTTDVRAVDWMGEECLKRRDGEDCWVMGWKMWQMILHIPACSAICYENMIVIPC